MAVCISSEFTAPSAGSSMAGDADFECEEDDDDLCVKTLSIEVVQLVCILR